ncbi:hypothetical protein BC940DRAFT_234999 [Gongronella butleri]|nr:hypothetical protein BC940DRAFT_234999 [Gongronella butleri]
MLASLLPNIPQSALLGLVLLVYCSVVRYYRYQHLNAIKRKYPDPDVILKDLDAAYEIYSHIFRREFPNVARTSLEFALFKTFVIPSVSKLLVSTGEFGKNCTKRAEDTEMILSEIIDAYPRIQNHRMDGHVVTDDDIKQQYARAALSVQRLNEIHGKYPIRNGDYLYTLALFLSEPVKWVNAYEWRPLDIREVNASGEYEKTEIKYAPSNWKCAVPTINHLLTRLPKALGPLVYKFVGCLLEPQMIDAFGIKHPSWFIRLLFWCAVRSRALFIRYFCLPRNRYLLRTPFHANDQGRYVPHFFLYEPKIYPNGYCIAELGPEKLRPASCPFARLHQTKETIN